METHSKSVEKDFGFQNKEWSVLRLGWMLMALFLLLGLLGFFGSGVVSWTTRENDAAVIEFERYLRNSMVSEIKISSKEPLPDSSIYLNPDYLRKMKIDKIIPEPALMELKSNRLRVKFDSDQADPVVLYIIPVGTGSQDLEIEIKGQKEKLNQYIYF